MKWNRKYNYPTSTRALYNGKRLYDVNNEKLPSVTTILAATKPQEEIDSLNRWRDKVGHKQADIISLHIPHTKKTNKLISYRLLFKIL